jgi:probable rRNA maturation factor
MEVEVTVQDYFFSASQSQSEVIDRYPNPISTETWESWFYQWLETMEAEMPAAPGYEISLRLTDDTEIQSINGYYRNKNQPTDVLAFAALEVDSPALPPEIQMSMPLYLGDLVISVETAYRQANSQGHSLKTELAWLASHGLLHLLGWDHPDEASLMRMLNQQEALLDQVNLTLQV